MNQFPPLSVDHPAIGEVCGVCGVAFVAGDRTRLVARFDAAFVAANLTVEADLVHTRCDDRVWWFGRSWGAWVNTECPEAFTPVDDVCLRCTALIRLGDRGLLLCGPTPPLRSALHMGCLLMMTVPPPWSDAWDTGAGTGTADAMPVIVEETDTYRILDVAGRSAIQCRLCDRVSEHQTDVHEHYCGRCHVFLDMVAAVRLAVAHDGATHDCGEWRTYRDQCAICQTALPPKEDPDAPAHP